MEQSETLKGKKEDKNSSYVSPLCLRSERLFPFRLSGLGCCKHILHRGSSQIQRCSLSLKSLLGVLPLPGWVVHPTRRRKAEYTLRTNMFRAVYCWKVAAILYTVWMPRATQGDSQGTDLRILALLCNILAGNSQGERGIFKIALRWLITQGSRDTSLYIVL